jgi:hypothetical protein
MKRWMEEEFKKKQKEWFDKKQNEFEEMTWKQNWQQHQLERFKVGQVTNAADDEGTSVEDVFW